MRWPQVHGGRNNGGGGRVWLVGLIPCAVREENSPTHGKQELHLAI